MDQEVKTYDNPLAEQEHIELDDFLKEYDWQNVNIDGQWLDPTEQYIRPRYTLSYNHVPFAPLGGIHGLTGQPGHGKTFTFTQLMVAILKGEWYGLRYELTKEIPNPSVLYVDTEMERGNTQLVMLRVYEMMGWDRNVPQNQFRILWLRNVVKASDRWRMTLKAIETMKPTVVFLDGLIDVIGDFNDNKECQDLIYACMSTASHYGLSLWCLLHENPGSEKMVGHAGSFLERKATDVLRTKKEKGTQVIFSVEQKKARSRDLDKLQFVIDDDEHHYGTPRILSPGDNPEPQQQPAEPTPEEVANMVSVIGTRQNISLTTLREDMKKKWNIGSTKAKEYIDRAVNLGMLTISDNRYTANPADRFDSDEYKLPF